MSLELESSRDECIDSRLKALPNIHEQLNLLMDELAASLARLQKPPSATGTVNGCELTIVGPIPEPRPITRPEGPGTNRPPAGKPIRMPMPASQRPRVNVNVNTSDPNSDINVDIKAGQRR